MLPLSPGPHEDSRDVPGFMLRAGWPGARIPRCPAVPASAPPAEQKSAAAASAIAPAAIAARRLPVVFCS